MLHEQVVLVGRAMLVPLRLLPFIMCSLWKVFTGCAAPHVY